MEQKENISEFTGEAIISYARSSRNQKYIEDNIIAVAKSFLGSGILIDDSSGIGYLNV
ncbi:MAG: hypothetical protein R2821_07905 [Flavobacteriaceae bacterium]